MCDICGRASCAAMFHSLEEQERYADVIEAFQHARDLRDQVARDIMFEEQQAENDND
jgi:hypothetical protein